MKATALLAALLVLLCADGASASARFRSLVDARDHARAVNEADGDERTPGCAATLANCETRNGMSAFAVASIPPAYGLA